MTTNLWKKGPIIAQNSGYCLHHWGGGGNHGSRGLRPLVTPIQVEQREMNVCVFTSFPQLDLSTVTRLELPREWCHPLSLNASGHLRQPLHVQRDTPMDRLNVDNP